MKTTKQFLTLALAAAFLTAGFSAGADSIYDWPAELDDNNTLFNRPVVNTPELVSENYPNMEEGSWATPFSWDGDLALPINGVTWTAGINPWNIDEAGQEGGGFEPSDYVDQFTIRFYEHDTSNGGPATYRGDPIHEQAVHISDDSVDWTPDEGADDNNYRYFHFGTSSQIGFNTWDPENDEVSVGDTLWLSIEMTGEADGWTSDENTTGSSIRWAQGTDTPATGSAGGYNSDYEWDGEDEVWEARDADSQVAASIHVVPEPASMTLLGLGLAGFATRRFLGRKKKA